MSGTFVLTDTLGSVFDNLKNTRFENKIDPDTHTVEVTLYFNEKLQTPKPA